MTPLFEQLLARAQDCSQLARDIDLIRPVTYEARPPIEKLAELLDGTAALYELRFSALFDAYCAILREEKLGHYPIEECVMQWWGACDDLRCAVEGAKSEVLDLDGVDNVLLGVQAMSLVRAARFHRLVQEARALQGAQEEPSAAG